MKLNLGAIVMTALVILAVVFAYNKFSGKNIADLGKA
jgi:hypothetical protein